jgi:hypothetical protein
MEGDRKVWPAATVRVGEEKMEGRVLGFIGRNGITRMRIAAADRICESVEDPSLWSCFMGERFLGYISDDDLTVNRDLLSKKVMRMREEAEEAENDFERPWSRREVWAMVLGAAALGFLAATVGRW